MPTLTTAQWFRWLLSNLDQASYVASLVQRFSSATTIDGKVSALVDIIKLAGGILESLQAIPREAIAAEILETQLLDAMADQPGVRGVFDRQNAGKWLRLGFKLVGIIGPMVAPNSTGLFDLLGKLEAIGS